MAKLCCFTCQARTQSQVEAAFSYFLYIVAHWTYMHVHVERPSCSERSAVYLYNTNTHTYSRPCMTAIPSECTVSGTLGDMNCCVLLMLRQAPKDSFSCLCPAWLHGPQQLCPCWLWLCLGHAQDHNAWDEPVVHNRLQSQNHNQCSYICS